MQQLTSIEDHATDEGRDDDRSRALPDVVVREIVRGIYKSRYAPGQKLVESDLIKRFGFSRGSIREAIRRLAAEGVVTLSLHRGAYIRSMTKDEMLGVLSVAEVLNGLAARTAAERIDIGDNRAKLISCMETVQSTKGAFDFELISRTRDLFFRTIVDIANNEELSRSLRRLHVHIARIQIRVPHVDSQRLKSYSQIAAAILAGKPQKAETEMRAFIQDAMKMFGQLPDDIFE